MPSYDTLTEATLAKLWPVRDKAGVPIAAELAVRNAKGEFIGARILGSRASIVIDPYLDVDWEVRPCESERSTSR